MKPASLFTAKTKKPGTIQHSQGMPARVHIHIPALDQAKAALAEHELTRPDAIKATHPYAPEPLRKAWEAWRDQHIHLRCLLEMAEKAAHVGWKPVKGNPSCP